MRRLFEAAVPAAMITWGCGDTAIEQTVLIDPKAPAYAESVEQCRQSDDACDPLCLAVLQKQGEGIDYLVLSECRFRQLGPSLVEVEMTYDYPQACGRRPAGLAMSDEHEPSLSRFLVACAQLEHASVFAFERLAGELRGLGAPPRLVRACQKAAADESRHAVIMKQLASIVGGQVTPASVEPPPERSVFAIAVENAVEGCVRETMGALLAQWQADHAHNIAVRAAMAAIAPDELDHAELSLAVHHFCSALLDDGDRRRIAEAGRSAARQLRDQLCAESGTAARMLGLPGAEAADGLWQTTYTQVWAPLFGA